MTDTKRERILAAIKDILETSLLTTQAGVFVLTQSGDQLITDNELNATVYRSRVEPLTRGETPAVIIEPVNDQPNDTNYYDQLDWTLRVRITTLVRDNAPDDASDLYTKIVHRNFVSEETLNGECLDIVPDRVDFSLFEADVPLAVVSQDFLVRYRTARTSG
jgi:hypothetical protein